MPSTDADPRSRTGQGGTSITNTSEVTVQMRKRTLMLVTSAVLVAQTLSLAQQAPKPMTNDDVIALVRSKKKVPESVIVSEIKSRPSKFNTSTNEIIRLTNAGVTENELNAIIAASNKSSSSAT